MSIKVKVEKIIVTKDYSRRKRYSKIDITNQVVMPIVDIERLDTTLDSTSITLINTDAKPIKPFTRFIITLTNDDNESQKIYRVSYTDNKTKLTYGDNAKYQHQVELLEPTKMLERSTVDNTTVTNLLAFLYLDDQAPYTELSQYSYTTTLTGNAYDKQYQGANYINDNRFYGAYQLGEEISLNIRLKPQFFARYWVDFIPLNNITSYGQLNMYWVIDPDGNRHNLMNESTFQFDIKGKYKFYQQYTVSKTWGGTTIIPCVANFAVRYEWVVNVVETEPQTPTRYTIKQVIDNILSRIGEENSVRRKGLEDDILYQLDPEIAEKLDNINSPEFTFTQNTLFGMLNEIGEYIMAIPRLKPLVYEEEIVTGTDSQGNPIIETIENDYSVWNLITFDFLGKNDKAVIGQETAEESTIDADNYASAMISNVQNSFQVNNESYASMIEPYDGGYVSTRTEDASFEVSNNSAIIKTSRPIQRIIELKVWYASGKKVLDITSCVKEKSSYDLLSDYASTESEYEGYTTKSSAIYYTRGSNIIAGLDYVQPTKFITEVIGLSQAIKNIISLKSGNSTSTNLADLMFKIKYVPYYNLKLKQYKVNIDQESGNNDLYYNQSSAQVDIESFGEKMKGALLRTSNEEPTRTMYFNDFNEIIHVGQVTSDWFYAYESYREITNQRIKASVKFSKDWNKLNEFVGIKKNYREWEISEKEAYETTPMYNEFCIISNKLDTQKDPLLRDENIEEYKNELAKYGGFISNKAIQQVYNRLRNSQYTTIDPIDQYAELSSMDDIYRYGFYPDDLSKFSVGQKLYFEDETYVIAELDTDEECFVFPVLESSKLYEKIMTGEPITFEVGFEFQAISWVVATTTTREYDQGEYSNVEHSFLLPCCCLAFGNSIVLNFSTLDNYAAATYVRNAAGNSDTYKIEEWVKYNNKNGQVDNLALCFGGKDAKINGFDNYNNAKTTSKQLYLFNLSNLNEDEILIDYREHPFIINKDSRQKLQYTGQLHFVVDENPNIWIGKGFAQMMPFVGATEKATLKFVVFNQKPDKFLIETNTDIWTEKEFPNCTVDYDLKYIKYDPVQIDADCVGYGFVDNQNRVVLYYDKELHSGDNTDTIYFQFRKRI